MKMIEGSCEWPVYTGAECRSSRASTTDRSAKELIYTAAPDAECTLDGLVSLAEPEPLKTARSPRVGSESSSASGRRRNAMA